MFKWLRSWFAPTPEAPALAGRARVFSTDVELSGPTAAQVHAALASRIRAAQPVPTAAGAAMDGGLKLAQLTEPAGALGEALFTWFGNNGFIGHQMCAVIAQHWLIDKACSMPARDAVRQGFKVALAGADTTADHQDAITKANRRFLINRQLQDFVRMGRVFGLRIAVFKFKNANKKFYERPFNLDSVTPGSFEGVAQIDPYWCVPELSTAAVSDPSNPDFYEPTWWVINGQRYHKSHLRIFRTPGVADILKPVYSYGGVPVPQKIMERVYAAERTANEGPQLAATKRLDVWKTDVAELMGNQAHFVQHMANMTVMRDNYGYKLADTADDWLQFDTTLTGLDEVIMTQYQIVASAANVPATKLLGTTPKGFNSTGEYEESSYHEELETIQENDLTPFLEHYLGIVLRSEVEPNMGLAPGTLHATVEWNALDAPTAKEEAETNKLKAETDELLIAAGAIDGADVRNRIREDKSSGYAGIEETPGAEAGEELDKAVEELKAAAGMGGAGGAEAELDAAMAALGAGGGAEAELERATAALTDG